MGRTGKAQGAAGVGWLCAVAAWLLGSAAARGQWAGVEIDYEAVSAAGKGLFEAFAPEDVKAEWEFADAATLRGQVQGLLGAFAAEDVGALGDWEPVAGRLLEAMRGVPGAGAGWASWLEGRLDFLSVAKELAPFTQGWSAPAQRTDPNTGRVLPAPSRPAQPPARPPVAVKPAAARAVSEAATASFLKKLPAAPPARAGDLPAACKRIFAAEGVPEELVWQAEVESSWNPSARSPAGAVGLYQFMAPSARENGLETSPVDQRLDAALCAAAAARYLKRLHGQFGDWALALAAYNTGPGRVRKLLRDAPERSFDGIYQRLSAETKLYVPKIDALVRLREGKKLSELPGPR